ncbi:hypothetical protein PV416_33235 [Streptomyces ipomoeae]|uniref:DUF6879 domain-containing protein n=1 Tax=Streptomyces ipomoeae 91-03 TaxID=698759 RepID=L1L1R2_9ACTN|nr:DUF6879 family protein [Streptomyces ipomoeae]EKX66635.1 hypothetical protein STRIP9103_04060 [Streptomyces ipomoeae 91-03]MDX2698109.1 hypothetical protein [Streptomyces ipomoeae]MDX2825804.1 hypothetical protein [Streptomyces ipomoeae]MDX2842153.1 hypothetical protein [Streptomyces ipomoeae]MDX2878548.1 hypothetical protein [Streptomyces ipomoeae]
MLLDGDAWRRVFDAYERDAWRFEAQPTYTMPREAENVARFLRGEPKPLDHNARWHERVRGYVASGRTIGRVRVVRQPLTDYQRYQFSWGIPGNIEAGEDIRVLDVTQDDYDLLLSGTDWWMFDETRIVHLNYRPDGTQINRELFTGEVAPYLEWKRIALSHSVPFSEYVKKFE